MDPEIAVLLLAAGESRRMGEPKMLLPWGETTVLGQVIAAFAAGFASMGKAEVLTWEIAVVTGGARQAVEKLVNDLPGEWPVRTVYNPDYARSEMLGSLQTGLRALGPSVQAAIIGLGDQPQVKAETVRNLWTAFLHSHSPLIVPSFRQRRGHPWLVARPLWPEILDLSPAATPRQFLHEHGSVTEYIQADESILQDLDTPEDYQHLRP